MSRIFIATDWMNMEGRLTAYISGDTVLQAELDAELAGGPKVHSLNAGLIYGCDPLEAKDVMVNLKGVMRPAYDAGKRLTHAFNYGMGARQMSRTFWVTEAFAKDAIAKLSDKYAGIVAWRKALSDEVFGIPLFECPRCGDTSEERRDCEPCSSSNPLFPVQFKYIGMAQPATRILRTPFGRIRRYLGRRKEGQNAVASQLPQGSGASVWYRTLARLHGWDTASGTPWPAPEGIVQYRPFRMLSHLLDPAATTFAVGGTYDSYSIETEAKGHENVVRWVVWTMEQPWPQLGGLRLPAEVMTGYNLGKFDKKNPAKNPNGLKEFHHVPFQTTWSQ